MITIKFFGMLGVENEKSILILDEKKLFLGKITLQDEKKLPLVDDILQEDEEVTKLGGFTESAFPIEATLQQVFKAILKSRPAMTEKQLNQAILFLNKKQLTGRNRLSTKLHDGDELTFLSPAGGG